MHKWYDSLLLLKVRSHCDGYSNGNFVQLNDTVHMVTDSNGDGNGIVVKWLADPFCDGNNNGKNSAKYTHMQLFCCHCHCRPLRMNRSATKSLPLPLPSQCERTFTLQDQLWKDSLVDVKILLINVETNSTFPISNYRLLKSNKETSFMFLPLRISHFDIITRFMSTSKYVNKNYNG